MVGCGRGKRGREKKEALQISSLNSFTMLLPLEPHKVKPLDYTQLASPSFLPQEENMAEYGISLAGWKMGLG